MVEFFLQLRLRPVVEVFLLLLLLCSPCLLWWSVVCGTVQFTQLSSSVSKSLTCYAKAPGSIPTDNHPGWQDRPSSTSSIFREEEVAALF